MQYDDADKIEEVYERYEKKMYYDAFEILKDRFLAEDAVHDAFIRLIRNRDKIRDIDAPRTRSYVNKTLRSSAIDIYRKNEKDRNNLCDLEDAENSIGKSDDINFTMDVIDQLPPKYQSVVRCRLIHNLSVNETAAVLKLTQSTVKKRYERARKMLAEMLTQ